MKSQQYRPSNETELNAFLQKWCSNCIKETSLRNERKQKVCPLLRKNNDKLSIIPQWVTVNNTAVCTSFVDHRKHEVRKRIKPKDELQQELFREDEDLQMGDQINEDEEVNDETLDIVVLRDYQQKIVEKATPILIKYGFVYLAMEMRTGKNFTAMSICQEIGAKNVVLLTKKKASSFIQKDYESLSPSFQLVIMNYESIHKLPSIQWDVIICDEAHSLGAFPKPSLRAKQVCSLIKESYAGVILMSGTPTPESFSQMYHQVYGIPRSPFYKFRNFYRFADSYVAKKQRKINGILMNDYSGGLDSIIEAMDPYTIRLSQVDAGFKVDTNEHILRVEMLEITYKVASKLQKDRVLEGKLGVVLGDTPVKLLIKLHQIYSGTVKFENGDTFIIDQSKAIFIKEYFSGKKIAIFYKFVAEFKVLKAVFGDALTTDIGVFNDTDGKNIALQIVSGREGISLKEADCLVYYNIDFSATSYWQSRDRMTTHDRLQNKIYWIFSNRGIEDLIYKAVIRKKDYTTRQFVRDFNLSGFGRKE